MKTLTNIIIYALFMLIVLTLGTAGTMGESCPREAFVSIEGAPKSPLTYIVFDRLNQNIQFNPVPLNIWGNCKDDWESGFPYEFLIRVNIGIEYTKTYPNGTTCRNTIASKSVLLYPYWTNGTQFDAVIDNEMYVWDGTFDSYSNPTCTGIGNVKGKLLIRYGYAKNKPGQPDHGDWMIHSSKKLPKFLLIRTCQRLVEGLIRRP